MNPAASGVDSISFRPCLRPQHADGRGQAVGRHAVLGDHGHAALVGQAQAGARIDDVRIAPAVDHDVLKGVARGGDGRIGQQNVARGRPASVERNDRDGPARLARRRIARADVAAGIDQCARDAAASAALAALRRRRSPWRCPPGRAACSALAAGAVCWFASSSRMAIADRGAGFCQPLGRRHFLLPAGAAPQADIGSDGDVERAARFARPGPATGPARCHKSSLSGHGLGRAPPRRLKRLSSLSGS